MVQRAHGKDAEHAIGACQTAGDGIDGAIASSGYDRLVTLGSGVSGQRGNVIASLGHHDLRLDSEFGGKRAMCASAACK
jgi:hypothetical protein